MVTVSPIPVVLRLKALFSLRGCWGLSLTLTSGKLRRIWSTSYERPRHHSVEIWEFIIDKKFREISFFTKRMSIGVHVCTCTLIVRNIVTVSERFFLSHCENSGGSNSIYYSYHAWKDNFYLEPKMTAFWKILYIHSEILLSRLFFHKISMKLTSHCKLISRIKS